MTIFPFTFTSYANSETSFPCYFAVHTIHGSFPSHRHDCLELSFVIEGAGREIVNGAAHDMRPGTFTFLLPYQIHELQALPGRPLRLYNCMLGMDLLMAPNEADWGLKSLFFEIDPALPPYVQFDGEERERMLGLMQSILDEYEHDRRWGRALIKAKLSEALIRFDRARRGQAEARCARQSAGAAGAAAQAPVSVWNVIYYIHGHFREELSLRGLAETFHFHASHLSELIHKHTGQPFVRLLHEIRLRHACALLASTEMKIADIAAEVGYGSTQTLFRAFKQYKGLSPQAYRRLRSSPAAPDSGPKPEALP
jgi:AraC-like DNA-binding protein